MTTVEERTLEINVIGAVNLENVKVFGKQNCLLSVYLCPMQKKYTPVDREGGRHPSWNCKFKLTCDEARFSKSGACLTVEIYSYGLIMNKFVGAVVIPLQDVVRYGNTGVSRAPVMGYRVRRRSGRIQGVLEMSVKLGEKKTVSTLPAPRCYGGTKQVGNDWLSVSGLPQYTPQSHQGYSTQQYYGYSTSGELQSPRSGSLQQRQSNRPSQLSRHSR